MGSKSQGKKSNKTQLDRSMLSDKELKSKGIHIKRDVLAEIESKFQGRQSVKGTLVEIEPRSQGKESKITHLKIPIKFEGMNLGAITIDYEPDISQRDSKEKGRLKNERIKTLEDELFRIEKYIKKDIDVRLRFSSEIWNESLKHLLIEIYKAFQSPVYETPTDYEGSLVEDDKVFKLIESEGPVILSSTLFQYKIEQWGIDEETFGNKVNKIRDSLFKYQYSLKSDEKLIPVGRPKKQLIEEIGSDWIKAMCKDITSILRIAKKNKNKNVNNTIRTIIENAYDELIEEGIDLNAQFPTLLIHEYFFFKDGVKPIIYIAKLLDTNMELMNEFQSYTWQPHLLAIEITAVILGVSVSTLEKILYSSKE